ncbi:MAG: bifunctional diaminohydroxyphosphoribosylaminopyrimidine deaminase/5-amino-6-(5-phosphoribosylamino)uracil reductase RibD [Xanthomonadales bacterium]|nr:bifunctional diaminohydroxyphosphoribosylaminopyrimidine deaminase/5-amino-6-(5-phosphoribosylamino)uracil reductase RibD [Xanthomonadales bacterium]
MYSDFDRQCMSRAFELARLGLYTTDPNPRVGCVLAREGAIVGEGWHRRAGGRHAEVHALEKAGDAAQGATAYVTLEPCSISGRTGPCTEALIEARVSRVIAAVRDPNPRVDGSGLARLREAGIAVSQGLEQSSATVLNPGFTMRMRHGRPWVRVKLALSLDGRSALSSGVSQWITGPESRADVQHWRARSSAVLTGIGTLLADDPSLNVRLDAVQRQPARIIVDSRWRTPPTARTMALPGKVIVAGREDLPIPSELKKVAECLPVGASTDGNVCLRALMKELAAREINELQVEAGATLAGGFLHAELMDELLIYQAPLILGSGARGAFDTPLLKSMSDRYELNCADRAPLGDDLRIRYLVKREAG